VVAGVTEACKFTLMPNYTYGPPTMGEVSISTPFNSVKFVPQPLIVSFRPSTSKIKSTFKNKIDLILEVKGQN
jgi:hypothetical protein